MEVIQSVIIIIIVIYLKLIIFYKLICAILDKIYQIWGCLELLI